MKRIYISGPITENPNAKEQFAQAEQMLAEEWMVWNPYAVNTQVADMTGISTHKQFMTISIAGLKMCDAIWMLQGWQDSKGAREEYFYARTNGKTVFINGKPEDTEV